MLPGAKKDVNSLASVATSIHDGSMGPWATGFSASATPPCSCRQSLREINLLQHRQRRGLVGGGLDLVWEVGPTNLPCVGAISLVFKTGLLLPSSSPSSSSLQPIQANPAPEYPLTQSDFGRPFFKTLKLQASLSLVQPQHLVFITTQTNIQDAFHCYRRYPRWCRHGPQEACHL